MPPPPPSFYTDEEYIWNEFLSFCHKKPFTFKENTAIEDIKQILSDWRIHIEKMAIGIKYGSYISNYWYTCTVDTLQSVFEKVFQRSLNLAPKLTERYVKTLSMSHREFEKMVNTWSEDDREGLQIKFFLCASLSLKWSNFEAFLCLLTHFEEELSPDGCPTGRIAYNFYNFGSDVIKIDERATKDSLYYKPTKYLEINLLNPDLCPVRLYKKYLMHRDTLTNQRLFLSIYNTNRSRETKWYKNKPIKSNSISTWKAASAIRADFRNYSDFRECLIAISEEEDNGEPAAKKNQNSEKTEDLNLMNKISVEVMSRTATENKDQSVEETLQTYVLKRKCFDNNAISIDKNESGVCSMANLCSPENRHHFPEDDESTVEEKLELEDKSCLEIDYHHLFVNELELKTEKRKGSADNMLEIDIKEETMDNISTDAFHAPTYLRLKEIENHIKKEQNNVSPGDDSNISIKQEEESVEEIFRKFLLKTNCLNQTRKSMNEIINDIYPVTYLWPTKTKNNPSEDDQCVLYKRTRLENQFDNDSFHEKSSAKDDFENFAESSTIVEETIESHDTPIPNNTQSNTSSSTSTRSNESNPAEPYTFELVAYTQLMEYTKLVEKERHSSLEPELFQVEKNNGSDLKIYTNISNLIEIEDDSSNEPELVQVNHNIQHNKDTNEGIVINSSKPIKRGSELSDEPELVRVRYLNERGKAKDKNKELATTSIIDMSEPPELVPISRSKSDKNVVPVPEVPKLVPICRCRKRSGKVLMRDKVKHKLMCFNQGRCISVYMVDVLKKITNNTAFTICDMLCMKFDVDDEYKNMLIKFFIQNSMKYVSEAVGNESDQDFLTKYRNFIRLKFTKYFTSTNHEKHRAFSEFYQLL